MDKSMRYLLVNIFFFLCVGCSTTPEDETRIITISDPKKEEVFSFKLKQRFNFHAMNIIENSLNDTFKIGVMKVPPRKVGKLFSVEFLDDSITYMYTPYKARTGNLKIERIFFDDFIY